MGAVTLRVQNLDNMIAYYRDAIGLDLISQVAGSAILGRGTQPALILDYAPELKYAAENEAGLFHTAFLFETKAQLAYAVASVASKYPGSFTGSADHLVSEAFISMTQNTTVSSFIGIAIVAIGAGSTVRLRWEPSV